MKILVSKKTQIFVKHDHINGCDKDEELCVFKEKSKIKSMLKLLPIGTVKIQKQRITLENTERKNVQIFEYSYCNDHWLPECKFLDNRLQKLHAIFESGGQYLLLRLKKPDF
ncbi:hypothetical protein MXB_3378 [Myxobolus squamalis]|nr:hypothetical protein MXB_3378 [Myxobolus squamalis]